VCGFPKSRADLFRTLRLLEVQETFDKAPRADTVARWRRGAPEGFEFTAKASQLITHGLFGPTDEVFAAWAKTRDVCEALGATTVVFESPPSFGPTAKNRDNLYAFFSRAETRLARAWEPAGTWPTHVVERVCEDLDLQHATDPFAAELADQPRAYYRLHGSPPGRTRHDYTYTDEDLLRLRAFCDEVDHATVVFDNVTKYEDALRFLDLVRQR
jgi:uncharacterized protein YecE (DUF72 family)